jgi:hypothetical protein
LILDNTKQVYDAIPHPPGCDLAGGIVPLDLDEDVLPTLEKLSKVALNKQVGSILNNIVLCLFVH